MVEITWYVLFPQGQCLSWLKGQGGHFPSWQTTSHIWYPHPNFFPHFSSHCHWGSEQLQIFWLRWHEQSWTLFLSQGGQGPSWQGTGQVCFPQANFFRHGLPQDQYLSKHLLVAGAVWPQKHLDLTKIQKLCENFSWENLCFIIDLEQIFRLFPFSYLIYSCLFWNCI